MRFGTVVPKLEANGICIRQRLLSLGIIVPDASYTYLISQYPNYL